MKKYISLFSFIALFFVGVQQSQAQDSNRVVEAEMPEAIAKKQTHELHQMMELTGDQQRDVYKVLVDYEQNTKALNRNDNVAAVQKSRAALMENVKTRMKSILTPEQFQLYLKSLEKPKQ
ncbi:hypothetical protein ACFS5M_12080 [Lacinutrix iliipiscaria]|uniref:LTXXQ motif family protein n=1 Tax=Lacinutrix iliipiscaria TaxID=1230532 RepID=A0ABW5WTA7_9FLAO